MCEHKCSECVECNCRQSVLTRKQLEIVKTKIERKLTISIEFHVPNMKLYYNAQLNLIDDLLKLTELQELCKK